MNEEFIPADMTPEDIESIQPISQGEIAESLGLDKNASWKDIKVTVDNLGTEPVNRDLIAEDLGLASDATWEQIKHEVDVRAGKNAA